MGGKRKMTDQERVIQIIEDLGGHTVVGEIVGLSKQAVFQWAVRGDVPRRYWPELQKRGIEWERLAVRCGK